MATAGCRPMTDPIAQLFERRKAQKSVTRDRMLHEVPDVPVVDREAFILERCTGKRVLNVGCNGTDGRAGLHKRIGEVAEVAYGMDREGADYCVDLDYLPDFHDLAESLDVDLVVCGEVLEHLANTGYFLQQLHGMDTPVIITVPNAYSANAQDWNGRNRTEQVNIDHVAWYSWRTLKTLVERYGYTVQEWYWYNGEPLTAEGLVFVVAPE